ncbi:transcriptional regulator [Spirilliplanes yamanashiensis]|uniref:Transcriptional regulator n=1 Tax=Spirilliplanes yamanashiensis TaxID=42233 RepID=A0A8J3YDJ1_9ACTN|nr:transcriptional regulator [Spirilliplanes yamanashiensis]
MADRVLGLFEGARLTPTQRRIAHALVQHAAATPFLSAAEVAELAGVSQPSVTRFAVALGHPGYPALRRELREAVGAGPADGPAESGDSPAQRALRAEGDTLYRLADQLGDDSTIAAAARLLAASRPLPVLGLRAAGPVATYFGYFAAKIHPDVRLLDEGGSRLTDRLDQARAAGAGAMLAVVLPRYPREALDAIREASAAGLTVVALTDSPVSPAADLADVALPAPVGTRLVFDLHTGPMAVAMLLLQAMCDAAPEDVQRRLEEFEHVASRRQIFAP